MSQLKICFSVYLKILCVKQFSLSLTLKEILLQEDTAQTVCLKIGDNGTGFDFSKNIKEKIGGDLVL